MREYNGSFYKLLSFCPESRAEIKLPYIDCFPLRSVSRRSKGDERPVEVDFGLPHTDQGRAGGAADDQRRTFAEPLHKNKKYPFELVHPLYEG